MFTLSVRSFQVPETPATWAWPPSLPSVPTSRATRVTSSANERQLVDHRVDGVLELEDLALASTVIFCDRSPCATAVVTWAMLRTWSVRLRAMKLTFSVRSRQVPETPLTSAWPPSLPSVPTSRATRVTSSANDRELVDHRVDGVLELEDLALGVDRDLLGQVALGHRRRDLGDVADLGGQVAGHEVDGVGQVLPGAGDARHSAWPPSLPSVPTSRATRVTSSANAQSWSTIVLMVSLSSRTSPLASTVIFCGQVAAGHRGGDLGDVADLGGQVRRPSS